MTLVVVHAYHRVILPPLDRDVEECVGWVRAINMQPLRLRPFDRRPDFLDFFPAEQAIFSGMRVQSGYGNPCSQVLVGRRPRT